MDKEIKHAAQKELRRLGFTLLRTSPSGSSYYERMNIDMLKSNFGTTDQARLSDHYHPTNYNGSEFDTSGLTDAGELVLEIREDFE